VEVISRSFVWPLMVKDVIAHVRSCSTCLKCDQQGHNSAPLVERKILTGPFESIGMDIIGPLKTVRRGNR